MKVLVVTNMFPTPAHPAEGVFVAREVEALRSLPVELVVSVLHIDTIRWSGRYLTGMRAFRREVRRFAPDIVHIHHGLSQVIAMSWFGPRVVTFHGSDLELAWQRAVSRALLGARATPIVVSKSMCDHLGSQAAKARVIPCGVDTEVFTANGGYTSSEWADGGIIRLGFSSSPDRLGKDYALFEKVVHELEDRGHPTTTAVLEGIAADQVPAFLRGLTCLMVTSRHEGSPVITKEAACTGTRIVSTDVGDVREQLQGLSGCRVVAERAGSSLADAVLAVLGEPGPDPLVAADRFAVRIEARRVFEVYQGLLRAASL